MRRLLSLAVAQLSWLAVSLAAPEASFIPRYQEVRIFLISAKAINLIKKHFLSFKTDLNKNLCFCIFCSNMAFKLNFENSYLVQ